MVFPVVMYGCESWTIKKAKCQRIDAFELWCWRLLKSPLGQKEIKPVNPKENQSWIFTGRTDVEAEALATWCKEPTHWKRPWCWERWRWDEMGMTEDEMVEWHHRLNGHEFEQTLGDSAAVHRVTKSQTWLSSWTTNAEAMGIFIGEWGGSREQAGTPVEPLFIHWCLSRGEASS